MAVTAPPPRKYNPGFLTDCELIASFCVRTREFESIVEMLYECTGSSNHHQIVIGPRGSGKTSLLLRVAAEVRRDAGLSAVFFPVVFAEESYEVATAGEFWLECLARLADQAPPREDSPDLRQTFEDLRAIRGDDGTLGERCLAALLDFSDREGKRLVLMVENLNMMFRDMVDPDAGWRLRRTLQTEPRIILLASATSRFAEIDQPKQAFYDLFRTLALRPLDTNECADLWEAVSGWRQPPKAIRSLEILTGGSPRLLAILARFGGELSFHKLMANLLDLVDDNTEYFKGHLESLPAQERRVYTALAGLWKPASTKEIADRARLDTNKCSSQLSRLVDRGVVHFAGGTTRRKRYYLNERLYNIYYLLRRHRGSDRPIEALIRFMVSYYSSRELKKIGADIAREAARFDSNIQEMSRVAFVELMKQPKLARYHKEMLAIYDEYFPNACGKDSILLDEIRKTSTNSEDSEINKDQEIAIAMALLEKGITVAKQGQIDVALSAFDGVVRLFGESEIPDLVELVVKALAGRAFALDEFNRQYEAQAAWEELVCRFGKSEDAKILVWIVEALVGRGFELEKLDRREDAMAAWGAVVDRYGENDEPEILVSVARALVGKGRILYDLDRIEDALSTWDEVVRRFKRSEHSILHNQVTQALNYKGFVLSKNNRTKEALDSYKKVEYWFENSKDPDICLSVALALTNMGFELDKLDRSNDALVTWDKVVHRFSESKISKILELVANSLINKGNILEELDRPQDALTAYDEVVNKFGGNENLDILELVAKAFFRKGSVLNELDGPNEALAVGNEMMRRFEKNKTPEIIKLVVASFVKVGISFDDLNQPDNALAAWEEAVRQSDKNKDPDILEQVVTALISKGHTLRKMHREEDALAAWDEAVRQSRESESPKLLLDLAFALDAKGDTLGELGRLREALDVWNEVADRFEKSENPQIHRIVANSLILKGIALGVLNHSEEALAAYDEVVHRFEKSEILNVIERVAAALHWKGRLLDSLDLMKDAQISYNKLLQLERFEGSESSEIPKWIGLTLLEKADWELECKRYSSAIGIVDRALNQYRVESPQDRWRALMIRTRAVFASGDPSAYEQDIIAMFTLLLEFEFIPKEALEDLMTFSIDLGPARMRELIQASPAVNLLLPLTTALERVLGLEPQVAQEVEEVAKDIRGELAKLKVARSDGTA